MERTSEGVGKREEVAATRSRDWARLPARLIATSFRRPFQARLPVMSTFDTVWPADSVEFCHHPDATDIFVCGTYKLEQPEPGSSADQDSEEARSVDRPKQKQKRRGKCLLFAENAGSEGTL